MFGQALSRRVLLLSAEPLGLTEGHQFTLSHHTPPGRQGGALLSPSLSAKARLYLCSKSVPKPHWLSTTRVHFSLDKVWHGSARAGFCLVTQGPRLPASGYPTIFPQVLHELPADTGRSIPESTLDVMSFNFLNEHYISSQRLPDVCHVQGTFPSPQ